jgi:hypothetical protein
VNRITSFLIIILLIFYFLSYMCETLEDKKTLLNRSSMCSSDQLEYKQIFIIESIVDSCFNQTTFCFSTVVSSKLLSHI